jgi:hypothetical protein
MTRDTRLIGAAPLRAAVAWLAPAIMLAANAPTVAGQSAGPCPPAGWSRESLATLKSSGWTMPDATRRDALARGMIACLASPDPELRDGLAFELLSAWMRGQQLSELLVAEVGHRLLPWIAPSAADSLGFAKPFAALVLSEVARVDRLRPFLTQAERSAFLMGGVTYLASISDYRGFDSVSGWRHGVAHAADLLMQLALNPALGAAEHQRILDAVATQVAPPGQFYVYGEGARLARPVVFIARRGTLKDAQWRSWLGRLVTPGRFPDWGAALATQEGLARRQDLSVFLLALYYDLVAGGDETAKRTMLPAVSAALESHPGS